MAQIQAPYNFVTGDTVNAANLNAHTNGAVLLPGSITDQPDILLPAVTGRAFTSSGGLVATVTSTAHGLSNGDQLDVTASVAAFSGRQTITVTSVDTFTFTLASTAPAVASGTLDYTKVNLVASSDSISIYDQSAVALKESTFGQIFNSGLSLNSGTATINTTVTSAINGKARSDINLTPNDGLIVTGKAFTSIDGITATVTSTAHGLETGMLLDVTASNAVYSGQHYITIVSVDTFSFVISQTTPVAASGTVDYTKKGTVKTVGNQNISGNLNVAGTAKFNSDATFTGNVVSNGNLTVSGSVSVAGNPVQNRVDVAVLTRELTRGTQYILTTLAWTDIPYNTINQSTAFVVNAASFTGTLSSAGTGTITLPAGTYVIEAESSIQGGGGFGGVITRVYNNTSSSVIKIGTTTYCNEYSHGTSIVYAVFTLSTTSNISIQYYADAIGSTSALVGPVGTQEVVFTSKITKLA